MWWCRLGLASAVLAAGCPNVDDTGDTGDTGDTDTGDTDDTDDTDDSGDTDTGDTDTGDTDTGDTDTGDTDTGGADTALNWDFEDWTSADPPPGFTKNPTADWSVTQGGDAAAGDAAAVLSLTATGPDRLLLANRGAAVPNSGTYRFHAWVHDDDPDVDVRLVVQAYYGTNLAGTTEATDPSADIDEWREYTLDVPVTTAQFLRPRIRLEEATATVAGSSVRTDGWAMTRGHSFDPGDGVQDAGAVGVAGTPGTTMDVAAAINDDGLLYVSTNFADQDSDHLLFIWLRPPHETETAVPPWNKAGLVAGPSDDGFLVVLIQENQVGKYCEWLVWDGLAWQATPGDACGDDNGPRLEGTLDLPLALGLQAAAVPRDFYVSVAPWESGDLDLGELKPAFQVPAGNGDTLLDPEETIAFSRVGLLLGHLASEP